MRIRKVISHKNLPYRVGISKLLLGWLALDHWSAPRWLCQAYLVISIIYLILSLIAISLEKPVDVIEEIENNSIPESSSRYPEP